MKRASNFLAFASTAVAVKTYLLIAITWSKGSEHYKSFRLLVKQAFSTSPAAQHA